MGIVSIRKTDKGIRDALASAFGDIGGIERLFGPQDRVLIKPNLNDDVCYTNKDLVESLVFILRDLGVSRVSIAESTFGTAAVTDRHFESTGYADLARRLEVPLVNLNASEAVEVAVKDPLLLESVRIAREVLYADKIVNVPVMKVHYATSVSLGIKNLKGFLVGREKRRFHETGLDRSIVDLACTVRAHLTIIDCIECMETMGPKGGDRKRLDTIVVSENPAEADLVGCRLMGFDPEEVAHVRMYAERQSAAESAAVVKGEPVGSVASPFKRAELGLAVLGESEIHGTDACCTCMNALILSLGFLEKPVPRLVFYLGSKIDASEHTGGITVSFGNCCGLKNADIRVKGCPPYPFELGERLKERTGMR